MSTEQGGGSWWSDEVRVLFRPYRTYGELATALERHPGGLALALRRPLRWLLIVGGFVSLTAAGRLVLVHLASAFVFWAFFPVLQVVGVLVARQLLARDTPRSRAVDLYFAGQAPWLVLFMALAGLCLFAPRVYEAFLWLLRSGVLPGLLVLTIAWSTFLTWVFLRRGLDLPRLRAIVGLLVLYAVYGGSLIGYYVLTDQIQPLLVSGGP